MSIQIIRDRKKTIHARRNGKFFAYKVKGNKWELWDSLKERTSFNPACYLHGKQVRRLMEALGGDVLPLPSRCLQLRLWKDGARLVVEVFERDFYDTALGDSVEMPCQLVEEYSSIGGAPLRLTWTEDDEW